jgi:ATP-dependent Clp protease protease subunit
MVKHTGQPLEVIERDTERDYYMDAEGAVKYGIVDRVLEEREKEHRAS